MEQIKSLKRLVEVGTTITGIGARVGAQEYLGIPVDEKSYAQKLRHAFGNLKGPFMKMAQFLATIPDALPPEFTKEFLTLQANAPSMGENFVKRRMAGELGAHWQELFHEFSLQASHAASLGQVHQATSKSGEKLAIKLQYPDMETAIKADLKQLHLILGIYHSFNKSIDTQEILEEIRDRLFEELDYTLEEKNAEQFRSAFLHHVDFVTIPAMYRELSTKRLLTMQWLDGKPMLDYVSHEQNLRNELGKKLFITWYWPLYRFGLLHGDPHPGNYLILEDRRIGLLDFGCARRFEKSFLQAVVDLYIALRDGDDELAVDAYKRWGFTNISKELICVLNQWANLLYEPLLEDTTRPIQDSSSGKRGWEIARKVHKQLHELGGIRPPREFVFMDRAAVGIGSVLMHLRAEQNWHRIFEEIIDGVFIQ